MNPVDNDNLPLSALISCIDLTSLNDTDTDASILDLCIQAQTSQGNTAAVCVFPQFAGTAWVNLMHTSIKIATVANFPYGDESLKKITHTIQQTILDGAEEIDIVLPKQENQNSLAEFVQHCKKFCDQKLVLKIILETGELSLEEIKKNSRICLENGADFLKTSTGKIAAGASLEAAEMMLKEIKNYYEKTGKLKGLKVSGGIRKINEAVAYVNLFKKILGAEAFSPVHFRIGASSLLQEILAS